MNNPIPALLFGGFLLVTGIVMLVMQRKGWAQLQGAGVPQRELKYHRRQYLRRSQIAGMILLIGAMIPLGDSLIPWEKAPGTFAVYWLIVLILAMWTGLLGIGDLVSTRLHGSDELNRLHRQEMQLRDAADRLQNKNGSPTSRHEN